MELLVKTWLDEHFDGMVDSLVELDLLIYKPFLVING